MSALDEMLEAALATSAGRLIDGSGTALDAPEIIAHARDVAAVLQRGGILPFEPVHLSIANRPSDIGSMLGIWLAGAVTVPIHISASAATQSTVGNATAARFHLDGGKLRQIAAAPPAHRPLLEGAALIVFTSGTTGLPKGVVIGHDAFAGKLRILEGLLGLRRDDVVVLPLQLTFIFGTWVALLGLISGSTVALVPKFSAPVVAARLAGGATVLAVVPTMLRTLLAGAAAPAAPTLRMVLTGGEMFGSALSQRLARVWPHAGVYDLYGSTETGSCDFCLRPEAQPAGIGSIGEPTEAVHYRLVGDGLGSEIGELQIRTPFGMLGYLDDPALTQRSVRDGYFRTGDLAILRNDGRIEIVGRSKEIISRGGNKIAPLEIDNLLSSHPSVSAALCTGIPDARLGEAILAVVVLEPGSAVAAADLLSWAAQRIEHFKLPDRILFSDALPLGNTGKASRSAIKALVPVPD